MNEIPEQETLIRNREGLGIRNRFQIRVLKIMFGDDEQKQLEWIEKNSKAISNIIDDPQNTQIRYLIEEGRKIPERHDEAARLGIAILNHQELPIAA